MVSDTDGGETIKRPAGRAEAKTGARGTPGLVLLYAAEFALFPTIVPFTEPQTILGRTPPPGGVALPQEAISRVHARFTLRDEAWYVSDLNSRNGTRVAGKPIREALLHAGDVIQLGDALFEFVDDGIHEYEGCRIDGACALGPSPVPELVGGVQMRALAGKLKQIAPSDLSVLVTGETGTGKEVAARAVHRMSGRAAPLVLVNCTTLSAAQLEQELLAQKAPATTLLLDEVGDMPAETQGKLLHLIERGSVGPRLVGTTHHDLRALVGEGRFRADLYARVTGCQFRLPPLRERKEDLYALVLHLAGGAGRPVDISFDYMEGLCHYDWPFNLRELQNVVRWSLATTEGGPLSALPDALARSPAAPPDEGSDAAGARRAGVLEEAEVRSLLQKHAGNVSAVARELGKDRAQIHRWMRERGIRPDDYREF
jgi:hypothetical protein